MTVSTHRQFKTATYEQFARLGKALSSPRRLELLDLLCQGERTVEVLAREAGLSVANASQHLRMLLAVRLVQADRRGQFVTYRLADEQICRFIRTMRGLAESHLTEVREIVRRYLEGRDGMDPVDRHALMERARTGLVTVIDVRPAEEYRAGHLPGALSIPIADLEDRLGELPVDQEVVAYCRGPYCVLAVRAVELLRSRGYTAARCSEDVSEWREQGLPVIVGSQAGKWPAGSLRRRPGARRASRAPSDSARPQAKRKEKKA